MNAANKKERFSLGPAGKAGRDVRSLVNLGETASTIRVLNLSQIYLNASGDKQYAQRPFFRDGRLNKCILIKHTLRANELDLFSRPRRTATKILIPFDPADLRVGAASIFVDQIGFAAFCKAIFAPMTTSAPMRMSKS